jgi:hypothetical protein
MRDAAEARAQEEGRSLYDILLDFIYDDELSVRDRSACIKLYTDKMHIAVKEGGEADKQSGLQIYLPEHVEEGKVVSIDR